MPLKKKKSKGRKKHRSTIANSTVWKVSLFSVVAVSAVFLFVKQDEELEAGATLPIAACDVSNQEDPFPFPLCCFQGSSDLSFFPPSAAPEYEELVACNDEEDQLFPSEPQSMPKEKPHHEKRLNSRFEIGGDYTYVRLKPASLPSFNGNLGGAQVLYEYRPMNNFFGAGTFSWKQGMTSGQDGHRFLRTYDAQEKFGYTFAYNHKKWVTSLFAGLGYRYMLQKFTQPGESMLRFIYNEFYVPVGFDSFYSLHSCFSLGLTFSWMPQFFSTVAIQPLKGAKWSLTNTISNMTASLPMVFTVTKDKRFQIIVKPFYQYWQDGHSTAELSDGSTLGLPGNTYNFYGADLNLAYRF